MTTALKYFTGEMPLRSGNYRPTEKDAKDLAGGVGRHDSQEWIPPTKTRIVYPGDPRNRVPHAYGLGCEVKLNLHPGLMVPIASKGENRQTKIPLESDWSPFESQRCWPVCRHTSGRQPRFDSMPERWR